MPRPTRLSKSSARRANAESDAGSGEDVRSPGVVTRASACIDCIVDRGDVECERIASTIPTTRRDAAANRLSVAAKASGRPGSAAGLAAGAVIGFVVGIADPLHGAPQTGQGWPNRPCTAISGRKAVTFSGKPSAVCSRSRSIHSLSTLCVALHSRLACSAREFLRHQQGRELCTVQDFVGIRVADAAEEMRIGERPLESVVFAAERVLECFVAGGEDLEAAGILLCQRS